MIMIFTNYSSVFFWWDSKVKTIVVFSPQFHIAFVFWLKITKTRPWCNIYRPQEVKAKKLLKRKYEFSVTIRLWKRYTVRQLILELIFFYSVTLSLPAPDLRDDHLIPILPEQPIWCLVFLLHFNIWAPNQGGKWQFSPISLSNVRM